MSLRRRARLISTEGFFLTDGSHVDSNAVDSAMAWKRWLRRSFVTIVSSLVALGPIAACKGNDIMANKFVQLRIKHR